MRRQRTERILSAALAGLVMVGAGCQPTPATPTTAPPAPPSAASPAATAPSPSPAPGLLPSPVPASPSPSPAAPSPSPSPAALASPSPSPSPSPAASSNVSGSIDEIAGRTLTIATNTGVLKVQVPEGALVEKEALGQLSDLKVGQLVGVTARPEAGGSLTAVSIRIFPAVLSGVRLGQSPMTGANQGNLMTNATIERWDGSTLVVDYSGEKATFNVPAGTEVIKSVSTPLTDLQTGWRATIVPTARQPDGTIVAQSVNVFGNPVR